VAPFDQPEGWIEGTGLTGLRPGSLYQAQLESRLMPVAVESPIGNPVRGYHLEQNYPNPFNPKTAIGYHLPVAGEVRVVVYDVAGREVAVLAAEEKPAGWHTAAFDASGLASGVYVCRLRSGTVSISRTMVYVR